MTDSLQRDTIRASLVNEIQTANMSDLPCFLDLEFSSPDEGQFPIAIAWSLPDGSIKAVMVCPDDDWEPWDNTEAELDLQFYLDQGVSGPDIIREINEDLSGQTVFIDGLDEDEAMLELLFETYDNSPDFELASLTDLIRDIGLEELILRRQDIANHQGLDLSNAEDTVRANLFLAVETTARP